MPVGRASQYDRPNSRNDRAAIPSIQIQVNRANSREGEINLADIEAALSDEITHSNQIKRLQAGQRYVDRQLILTQIVAFSYRDMKAMTEFET